MANAKNFLLNNPISHMNYSQPPSTKGSNKSTGYYIYDEKYDRKNMKKLLYEDYEEQVRQKKQK